MKSSCLDLLLRVSLLAAEETSGRKSANMILPEPIRHQFRTLLAIPSLRYGARHPRVMIYSLTPSFPSRSRRQQILPTGMSLKRATLYHISGLVITSSKIGRLTEFAYLFGIFAQDILVPLLSKSNRKEY